MCFARVNKLAGVTTKTLPRHVTVCKVSRALKIKIVIPVTNLGHQQKARDIKFDVCLGLLNSTVRDWLPATTIQN